MNTQEKIQFRFAQRMVPVECVKIGDMEATQEEIRRELDALCDFESPEGQYTFYESHESHIERIFLEFDVIRLNPHFAKYNETAKHKRYMPSYGLQPFREEFYRSLMEETQRQTAAKEIDMKMFNISAGFYVILVPEDSYRYDIIQTDKITPRRFTMSRRSTGMDCVPIQFGVPYLDYELIGTVESVLSRPDAEEYAARFLKKTKSGRFESMVKLAPTNTAIGAFEALLHRYGHDKSRRIVIVHEEDSVAFFKAKKIIKNLMKTDSDDFNAVKAYELLKLQATEVQMNWNSLHKTIELIRHENDK